MSMRDTLGSDTQALIKAAAFRVVDLQRDTSTTRERAVAEGCETAHLRR